MYRNVGSGLKLLFIAQIVSIIAAVFSLVPVLGFLLALASGVLNFMGLWQAAKDEQGYQTAMIITIVNVVLALLTSIPIFGKIIKIVRSILSLIILYYVCNTTANLLRNVGRADIAAQAVLYGLSI